MNKYSNFLKRYEKICIWLYFCISLAACFSTKHYERKIIKPVLTDLLLSDQEVEFDHIYSLLVYSLVYQDWQNDDLPLSLRRGYNIGALLVDKQNNPVFYGLNCINSTNNATQHGEVRAITGYIQKEKCFNLDGFTIYTSLEPCIMCAGMMTMSAVRRVVFSQHDVEYSQAFERLAIDTRHIGGFPPYPRRVLSYADKNVFAGKLNAAYKSFLSSNDEKILAKFLSSPAAKEIFKDAADAFAGYKVTHIENKLHYERAIQFLKQSLKAHGN